MANVATITKRNMGRLDRTLRIGIGLLLIYVGFIDASIIEQSFLAALVGILGIANIAASISGFCPVYKLAGICTY